MKKQVYIGIAARIIVFFVVGMLATYIPDHLRGFFGDTRPGNGAIDPEWTWGIRHYWYFWMMFTLFILSVVDLVVSIIALINKHYPD